MRASRPMWLIFGALLSAMLLGSMTAPAAPAPKVVVQTDKNPDPGENFTLTFTLTSYQTANYTILVAPRPELAFRDLSNGSRTLEVGDGNTTDLNFDMQVSRSARQGTYLVSYSVLRNDATVKMGTVEVKVGAASFCASFGIILPIIGVAAGMTCAGRIRR